MYVDMQIKLCLRNEMTPDYLGQGIKICPSADMEKLLMPHFQADRNILKTRLSQERALRIHGETPEQDVFQRTSAYITAVQRVGCTSPACESTFLLPHERSDQQQTLVHRSKLQRGYSTPAGNCQGRIVFDHDFNGHPLLR